MNIGQKTKIRLTFLILGFIISSVFFASQFFSYVTQIVKTKEEHKNLEVVYSNKLKQEDELNEEMKKLEDPQYFAKWTRENYLLSKKDEIIFKIK